MCNEKRLAVGSADGSREGAAVQPVRPVEVGPGEVTILSVLCECFCSNSLSSQKGISTLSGSCRCRRGRGRRRGQRDGRLDRRGDVGGHGVPGVDGGVDQGGDDAGDQQVVGRGVVAGPAGDDVLDEAQGGQSEPEEAGQEDRDADLLAEDVHAWLPWCLALDWGPGRG